jgi:hypothetical protein
VSTPKLRRLGRWRLRLAYVLLGLDYARQPRVDIELWTAEVRGNPRNPHDLTEIITYERRGRR